MGGNRLSNGRKQCFQWAEAKFLIFGCEKRPQRAFVSALHGLSRFGDFAIFSYLCGIYHEDIRSRQKRKAFLVLLSTFVFLRYKKSSRCCRAMRMIRHLSAYTQQPVTEDLSAIRGENALWVELDSMNIVAAVAQGHNLTFVALGSNLKAAGKAILRDHP